jgi:hypothetical protein
MGQGYRHFQTSVCLTKYHFVWIPKRGKRILAGSVGTGSAGITGGYRGRIAVRSVGTHAGPRASFS